MSRKKESKYDIRLTKITMLEFQNSALALELDVPGNTPYIYSRRVRL